MREVYLLNKGVSVQKAKIECKINREVNISNDTILNNKYIETKQGNDDITIVKNYYPFFEYRVKENEGVLDILSRGFEINGYDNICEDDLIILTKPSGIRYIVKPLESLQDISKRFGVDEKFILETNKLTTNKLFVGQILWL